MTETEPSLTSLAGKITELTESFTKYLKDNKIPEPSFAVDSPTSYAGLSPEVFMLRQNLIDAINDMWYLTQGPSESVFNYVHCVIPDSACLNTLNYFNFWAAVPVDGSASYADISKHVSLPEEAVRRITAHAITLRIFAETEPGKPTSNIKHNSRSAALSKSQGLRALVSTVLDDAGPPVMVMNEALERYAKGKTSLAKDQTNTSFSLFHSGELYGGEKVKYKNSWEFMEGDGEGEKKGWRSRNFATFMQYLKDIFMLDGLLLEVMDWKALGNAHIVDVGGSAGHDAAVIAKAYPDLKFTVQDLPKVKSAFEATVPSDLVSRVSFTEHSFFNEQPVKNADVYMYKLILHDWPDSEAVKILRALIPALKPGAKVMILEYVGSHEGESAELPRSVQQMGTATDLRIMALFNTKERPVAAWKELFRQADERFEVEDSSPTTANPFFARVVAVWKGE